MNRLNNGEAGGLTPGTRNGDGVCHVAFDTSVCTTGSQTACPLSETMHRGGWPCLRIAGEKKRLYLSRRRHLREDGESHQRPGRLVHDHSHPPAERPALRQRIRKPRHPEACPCRDGREIEMPNISWISRNRPTTRPTLRRNVIRRRTRRLTHDATKRRRSHEQPYPCEHLRHPIVSHGRKQSLQLPHEIPDEIRVAIDWLVGLDEGPALHARPSDASKAEAYGSRARRRAARSS